MPAYVQDLMSRPVETVAAETQIREAAADALAHDVGALVVVDDADRLEGLLTATDVVRLAADGVHPADAIVGEWMRTDLITTEPDTAVPEAAEAMLQHRVHHVPVVEDGTVVGMLTSLDLAAAYERSAGR